MRALCLCMLSLLFCSASPKLTTLYNSLDPFSVSQNLAFYELYPQSTEGQKALQRAWFLLSGQTPQGTHPALHLSQLDGAIRGIIALVNKQPYEEIRSLTDEELSLIESLGKGLANRKLQGHFVEREEALLALPTEQFDLARALFLSEKNQDEDAKKKARTYEALLDLMALQIQARLPSPASPADKVAAISQFIFEEMEFCFPPHSCYAKDIDLFTFLPSVLDSRKGVCLGVSILYLSLAQRLDLPLEMVTPPGHIYVRLKNGDQETNIETTARGIHRDSEDYLGINTRSLQQRTIKEVVGLAHINRASNYLMTKEYEKALANYTVAQKYLPTDFLLKELMAYSYLLAGKESEGRRLLKEVQGHIPEHVVAKESLAEDYLKGRTDKAGLQAMFMEVDETRQSLLLKKSALEAVLQTHPDFHSGYFQLAATLMQLHRESEALEVLKKYQTLEPADPTAEYYLAALYAERRDDNKSWHHLHNAEKLVAARNHAPKALKELRKKITLQCPE